MKRSVPISFPGLALVLAAVIGLGAARSYAGDFKIEFDYGQADASVFNADVKQQLECAGNFLASFIGGTGEVSVVVKNDNLDGKSGEPGAFATAAPSEWLTNDDTKSISKAGGITFNTKSLADVKSSSIVALTIHELLHVLGFTESSKAFAAHLKDGKFQGEMTLKMNKGEGPAMRGGHFVGAKDALGVEPRMNEGGGELLSCLDLAVLADLGYEIPQLKGKDGPVALDLILRPPNGVNMGNAILLQGLSGNDILIAEGGDCLMAGAGGNNTLANGGAGNCEMVGHNTQVASYGQDGKATFVIRKRAGSDNIRDFNNDGDVLMLAPDLGFENVEAALAALAPKPSEPIPGSNMSRIYKGTYVLKLEDGQSLSIVTKGGAKPGAANIKIEAWKQPE